VRSAQSVWLRHPESSGVLAEILGDHLGDQQTVPLSAPVLAYVAPGDAIRVVEVFPASTAMAAGDGEVFRSFSTVIGIAQCIVARHRLK